MGDVLHTEPDVTSPRLVTAETNNICVEGCSIDSEYGAEPLHECAEYGDPEHEGVDRQNREREAMENEAMGNEAMGNEAMENEAMEYEAMEHEAMEHEGMELEGTELEGMELEGMELEGMELEGMELEGMELEGMELEGMELEGVKDSFITVRPENRCLEVNEQVMEREIDNILGFVADPPILKPHECKVIPSIRWSYKKLKALQNLVLLQHKNCKARGTSKAYNLLIDPILDSPLSTNEAIWAFDRFTLIRYLVARDGSVTDAAVLLLNAINLRKKMKPERLSPRDARITEMDEHLYLHGRDRKKQPIVYFRPHQLPKDSDAFIRLIQYTLERITTITDHSNSVYQFGLVVQLADDTELPSISFALEILDICQTMYVELLSYGFVFSENITLYKSLEALLTPFVPKQSTAKFTLVDKNDENDLSLVYDKIAKESLEDWIPGGTLPHRYHGETYWKNEEISHECYIEFLKTMRGKRVVNLDMEPHQSEELGLFEQTPTIDIHQVPGMEANQEPPPDGLLKRALILEELKQEGNR